MTFATEFLDAAVLVALALLSLAFLIIVIRVVVGPTLPDRVIALDMLVTVGIGFIAAFGVKSGFFLYLDVAIALGLVGFLATVAFARYIIRRCFPDGPDVAEATGVGSGGSGEGG
jgi:multicomponent Na+:H+ antiporter subunit F